MTAKKKQNLAWLVQVEQEFGTRHIRAHIVMPQENGELHSPQADFLSRPGTEYAELRVSAYLGEIEIDHGMGTRGGKMWGCGHGYKPYFIESVERATQISRMLGKIQRGLAKAQTEQGYVADGDFLAYLGRIGEAIGVKTYYVRNSTPFQVHTGERWRKCDMPTLQFWLREVVKYAETDGGKLNEMIRG